VNVLRGMCFLAAGVLMSCTSPDADWKQADAQGTIAAYEAFLKEHPNDERAVKAHERIHTLQDEQAWAEAEKTNSSEAFEQYLQKQPNGAHATEAHDRVAALERAAAWKVTQADGKEAALQQFLQKYNQGPESDQARARLEQLSGYRVQLASFRSTEEARRDSARMQARYGKLLHEVVVVPPTPPDKLNYVRSKPMSLADAQSACVTLKNAHQHCEIVKR
jgi:outer membrane protein assembly factor BamD (BamD/ComL family)